MAKHRPLLRAAEKRDGGSLVHKRPGHPRAEGFPNKKCASRWGVRERDATQAMFMVKMGGVEPAAQILSGRS